ncbi:MAG TPA: acyl carrier protein [Acidimicrobiales bacterium]|nr:acyl carrier protein [Acidimicrobiales bacterium]
MTSFEDQGPPTDVEATVVREFQRYLDTTDDLPLDSHLLDDLGLESIVLVTILLDLSEQFGLDLASPDVNLADVQTLGDVVALVRSLGDEAAPAR